MDLKTPIELIPRIGSAYAKKLEKLGLSTVQDLLFYFPHRYEDFSHLTKVKDVVEKQKVCLKGKIIEINNHVTFRHRLVITEALFKDPTGTLKVVWFNQPYLAEDLLDQEVYLAGQIKRNKEGIYLSSPIQEKVKKGEKPVHLARLVPVYPETKGLTSRWLRYIIKNLLPLGEQLEDPLPDSLRKKYHLIGLSEAIAAIHFPSSLAAAAKAKERLAFEELFLLQLQGLRLKQQNQAQPAFAIPINLPVIKQFIQSLDFSLTDSQRKTAWQILQDLTKAQPMSRLLEGDVGSGKTVVAAIAILNTAKAKYQSALMAPTSVLAQQHFQTFQEFFKGFRLRIALLTNDASFINQKKVSPETLLKDLKDGKINLLIGTHSLIQDRVQFKNLAFVIVDEQHRFGVNQRAKLRKTDNFVPHFLSITATPIPRTLALTLYGDLDLSLLTEIPKNRLAVQTSIVKPSERSAAYQFIRKEIKAKHQVFVVCPRIEAGSDEVKTATEEYKKLSKEIFPEFKVGLLHGRLKPAEKEKVLQDFQKNKIQILVATSVVEVGLDIPNATVMMIEGAERFGLAQLHQLRGRVGRSFQQSYCFLFTESASATTRQRLKALEKSQDGFALAEKDLQLRGPGDIYGHNQWGIPDLAMANLNNLPLIEKTRQAAKELLDQDPDLSHFPLLRKELKRFHEKTFLE